MCKIITDNCSVKIKFKLNMVAVTLVMFEHEFKKVIVI